VATPAAFSDSIRTLPRWVWIVAALGVAVALFVALFDWNWLKAPVERRVQAATGRTFAIGGELDVDLGLKPRISANDVRLGNAPWSTRGDMVRAERIEFRLALLPLLRGRFEFPYLRASKPVVVIERHRDGRGNWQFDAQVEEEPKRTPFVLINQLLIEAGKAHVIEQTFRTELSLNVRSDRMERGQAHAPLIADGAGTYRGHPFKLDLRVDSPLDLQDRERPYHVDATLAFGATRARAQGALVGQFQPEDFSLLFEIAGSNLGDLYPLFGVALPDTPPYALTGQLSRDGARWSYEKFKGTIGDSDMQGDASFELGRERRRLQASVVSTRLDFDDLGVLVGAPPSTQPGETASQEQREAAEAMKARPNVLPDSPFNLDKLRTMDADVTLLAARINAPKLPLEQMDVHLQLNDGVLKLDPLDFKVAGGAIASRVNLDARQTEIRTTLTGEVRALELAKLFPSVEITKKGAGKLSGAFAVEARGNSVAQMFGSADGNIGLIMGPGHVSNLLVELAGLDVAETLKFLLDKDKEIPLRCAYADFKLDDGMMTTTALAFDTSDTVIHGEGKVSFRDEALDMRLVPLPKDRSPLSLRVPLKVAGSFKDPSLRPEAGPLALRGAAAAALYAIAPPAALLALIETGPGDNIDCGPAGASPT
jgi:AsmA family protein